MTLNSHPPRYFASVEACVEAIVSRVGPQIVVGTPLAAGKPNHLLNALYRKVKGDPQLHLTIATALTLERPKPKTDLERRFLQPFVERVFGNYPDLDYELDRVKGQTPKNVRIVEFYFPAGKFTHNPTAQQDYISSNYTHVYRDMMALGVNVLLQQVSKGIHHGDEVLSLSCNPDVTLDLLEYFQKCPAQGKTVVAAAQINQNLPFMHGDALVPKGAFNFIVDQREMDYTIFGPPKMSVPDADYLIGIYASSLIRDEGELQVGIGALGDALVYALKLRQQNNHLYRQLLDRLDFPTRFAGVVAPINPDLGPFTKGLLGASEMLVDGFLHLMECGILKREVYDHVILQRLINQKLIDHHVSPSTIEFLLAHGAIKTKLTAQDVMFLQRFGIFQPDLRWEKEHLVFTNGEKVAADLSQKEARERIYSQGLGQELTGGAIVHGGFYLGPQSFYQALHELPEYLRQKIHMKSVRQINHLFGHEELDRLHRRNARFVNTCLKMTLLGNAASDALESGQVISGVGGQYNFVAMAHELPEGRSILSLRSTRANNRGHLQSNLLWQYGHTTIPRHLRDVVVTEYGVADLRSKTDNEVIASLLNICDSRFQPELLRQAQRAGKISHSYRIADEFRQNYPQKYQRVLGELKPQGLFPRFPFGTDFTELEQSLGKALKHLQKQMRSPTRALFTLTAASLAGKAEDRFREHLRRMDLDQPSSPKERLYQRLLCWALKNS